MSHRIELKKNLAIIQYASIEGKTFELLDESTPDINILLKSTDLEEVMHQAEYEQDKR